MARQKSEIKKFIEGLDMLLLMRIKSLKESLRKEKPEIRKMITATNIYELKHMREILKQAGKRRK